MKKIFFDLKTRNKYKPNETSEEYKVRIGNELTSLPGEEEDTVKLLKKSFDFNLFKKLLDSKKDTNGGEMANILAKSCYYENELEDIIMADEDHFFDNYRIREGIFYNSLFPKLDNKISYVPIYSYYHHSHELNESSFHKIDLLKLKGIQNSYIIKSGWIRNNRYYSTVEKKFIGKKISIISESLKMMNNEFLTPGAVAVNGSLKWNKEDIFKSIKAHKYDPFGVDGEDLIEDCCFLFFSKNQKAYENLFFSQILDRGLVTGSIWDEKTIDDTSLELKFKKDFNKYFKKLFKKKYFLYNYKKKIWEISYLFG